MIHIITDSTFCVDEEYKAKHNIKIAELTVLLDGKTYRENNIERWNEYYEALKNSKSFPKTTQPSPETFINLIEDIKYNDRNAEIIILTMTQTLSGTYNCAKMIAKNYKNVTVIDSENACEASLILLEEIVEAKEAGKSVAEIVELAEQLKPKIAVQFVPSTLEYLKRGGRISAIKSAIANLLNLKPILIERKGTLKIAKKCLGVKKAIVDMINSFKGKLKRLYVVYVYESKFLNEITEKAKAAFGYLKVKVRCVSPVVGSHIGIGAVGLATLEE